MAQCYQYNVFLICIKCLIHIKYNVFYQGECFYRQGSGPIAQYVQSKRGQTYGQDNGPILHTSRMTISHFCDTLENWSLWRKSSVQWNQLSVCEIFCTHTLRLVSPWGCPGNPEYPTEGCPMAKGHTPAQYTAYSPERLPYGQETAPTVSPAYPVYPSFRQNIPKVPSIPSKHSTDYKTTRLHSQPTESITKCPEEANTENTEKSLAEAA